MTILIDENELREIVKKSITATLVKADEKIIAVVFDRDEEGIYFADVTVTEKIQ